MFLGSGIIVPDSVTLGFQERKSLGQQYFNIDEFYRLTVSRAQCDIGTAKHPDGSENCLY